MPSRRKFLAGIGVGVACIGGLPNMVGAAANGIRIGTIDVESETLRLYSDARMNLSGYAISFGYQQGTPEQSRAFPDGTIVEANDVLTVATGAGSDDADVVFDFEEKVIDSDGDRVAVLDTQDNVVASVILPPSHDGGIRFGPIDAEAETLRFYSETRVDLSGYTIDFAYEQETDQSRAFPDNAVIKANGTLTIATGAGYDDADVVFNFEEEVISDDDIIALLDPEGTVVASSTVEASTEEEQDQDEEDTSEPTDEDSEKPDVDEDEC